MKRVLGISAIWPEVASTAAGVRVAQITEAFRKRGFEVAWASHGSSNPFRDQWAAAGVKPFKIQLNSSEEFKEIRETFVPDILWYDRFLSEEQHGARAEAVFPNAIRVVDSVDFFSLRKFREGHKVGFGEGSGPNPLLEPKFLDSEILQREMASFLRSDFNLMLSHYEMQVLREGLGYPHEFCFLPFAYAPWDGGIKSFEDRDGVGFIGNFRHAPNRDAVLWFTREIWPRVLEQNSKAKLYIAGAYPTQDVSELGRRNSSVIILPHVPDAAVFLQARRLSIAPLRFGSGIKGKVAESFRVGTPVVGTALAFEGMYPGEEIAIPNSTAECAEIILKLLESEEYWAASSARGVALTHYQSREYFDRYFEEFLEKCSAFRPETDRRITARLLRTQAHRAELYFSRWIETKEKLKKETTGESE